MLQHRQDFFKQKQPVNGRKKQHKATVNLQYGVMQDFLPDEEYLFQGGDSAMKEVKVNNSWSARFFGGAVLELKRS